LIYKFKSRWASGGVSAQVVGERLEEIRRGRRLTPKAVVDDARPARSPLHPCFEWNDSLAAEKYRLEQARGLIQNVVVVYEAPKGKKLPVRAFVSVTKNNEREYTSISAAVRSPNLRQQLLEEALAEIVLWRQKYSRLQELSAIFGVVDRVMRQMPLKLKASA
jgi:hypothetical protein